MPLLPSLTCLLLRNSGRRPARSSVASLFIKMREEAIERIDIFKYCMVMLRMSRYKSGRLSAAAAK